MFCHYFFKADLGSVSPKIWLTIFTTAIIGATAFLFYAKSLRHSEVSVSSSLLNFRPAMTFLLAFFFLKERLSIYQALGVFILIIGAYLLEIKDKKNSIWEPFRELTRPKASHYMFLAILLYGVSTIFDKIILSEISTETYIFCVHFFVAVIFIFYISLFHDGFIGISNGIKNAWKYIAIVAILTVSYRFMQAKAISLTDVSAVMPIKHTSTLFTVLIGGRMFGEQNIRQKLFSAAIMVLGASLVVIG